MLLPLLSSQNYWLAPTLAQIDESTSVLDGAGVRVYANENERLTHFSIYHGKGADGEWSNVTVAINAETFSASYYGDTDGDRVERKVETEWLPADPTPDWQQALGVTHGQALALAVRRVEYQGHAPTVFAWHSDFRERTLRVGAVLTARFSEWQDMHGEARPVQVRIIKSEDTGDGVLKLEAQALGIARRADGGAMNPIRFGFIAPDSAASDYDTATATDRLYCYIGGADGKVGAAGVDGYEYQ